MKPDQDPTALYSLAIKTLGQVGCLLGIVIGAAVIGGLLLDQLLGTDSLALLILLLGSVPVSLFVIYRYTMIQAQRLQSPPTSKEDLDKWE